ncbi:MAG: phosphotransferase, partial [Nocardioidaceae bacterium]
RDAEVYAEGAGRVRRRYRDGRDASGEAAVMRWLDGAGFPVPTVYAVDGPDLVMARVEGPTLAESLLSDQVPPAEAGLLLAHLHDRLHALGPPQGDLPMGHLDLHPLNVLMSPDGPVVIDWSNARPVEPAFDVAVSVVILACTAVVLPPELAGVEAATLRGKVATLLSAFLDAVSDDPADGLAEALAWRGRDPNLSDEERAGLPKALAWAQAL